MHTSHRWLTLPVLAAVAATLLVLPSAALAQVEKASIPVEGMT